MVHATETENSATTFLMNKNLNKVQLLADARQNLTNNFESILIVLVNTVSEL